MNRLSEVIAFLSTTECGVIKTGELYLHIFKEELVVEGLKLGKTCHGEQAG